MPQSVSRRTFLGTTAAASVATTASANGKSLPTRVLGKTGRTPSILALGCGSRLLAYKEQDKGIEAVNLAIDSGITYLDTAQSYGNGTSETWVGHVMKERRDEVFLATKVTVRGYDEALANIEMSLKRLQTDQIDLIHIHSLQDDEDLANAEKGVLKALYKMRDEQVCKHIGVTSHTDPAVLATALERHDFDCTQMALNGALQGNTNRVFGRVDSFEEVALPVAKKKNLGVIAMKVTGQEKLLGKEAGKTHVENLLRYSLSLPVAVAVIGMPKLDYIRENTTIARSFEPLSNKEMNGLNKEIVPAQQAALNRYFEHHVDA